MTAVMLSIRPAWCAKIANGKKTVEVRKSKPKLETPFKCYIYCTKGYPALWKDGKEIFVADSNFHWLVNTPEMLNGKIIGEFICDAIVVDKTLGHNPQFYSAACMEAADIAAYCVNAEMYGWHISELKIYDKPKELSEFLVEDNRTFDCPQLVAMKRAPQSWCYVEGSSDNG